MGKRKMTPEGSRHRGREPARKGADCWLDMPAPCPARDAPEGAPRAHLAGAELADEQRAPLRVFPPVQAVQLGGHLVQLLVGIVELGEQLRVGPLRETGTAGVGQAGGGWVPRLSSGRGPGPAAGQCWLSRRLG